MEIPAFGLNNGIFLAVARIVVRRLDQDRRQVRVLDRFRAPE